MADGCFDLPVEDDFFLDLDLSVFTGSLPVEDLTRESASPFVGEIESLLMKDENHDQQNFPDLDHLSVSDFLEDLFVDYPSSDSPTDKVSDLTVVHSPTVGSDSDGKEAQGTPNDSGSESQDGGEIEGNDDAVAKKRTRRLRNRDAAVRSRERKKEYVKDLETKSKYLERECMRLGRILDCFAAENQSLRLCLQKGGNNNAPITRQESAVLLLESLLLGSLLWYLGDIICQFPQPHTKSWFLHSLETDEPERSVQSERGSSIPLKSNNWKSRRCKGSRPRMKQQVLTLVAVSRLDKLSGSDVHGWGAVTLNMTYNGFVISDQSLNQIFNNVLPDSSSPSSESPPSESEDVAPGKLNSSESYKAPSMFDNCKKLSEKCRLRWSLNAEEGYVDIGLEATTG